jgi:hypothetical protein
MNIGINEALLRAQLLEGPRDSRLVIEVLTAGGMSSKQIRGARERLGVQVSRSGRREAMRTTWQLPSAPIDAPSANDYAGKTECEMQAKTVRKRNSDATFPARHGGVVQPSLAADVVRPDCPDSNQLVRTGAANRGPLWERRRVFLMDRGMTAAQSCLLADSLAVRDAGASPEHLSMGSCAECQAAGTTQCKAELSWMAVHSCGARRRISP